MTSVRRNARIAGFLYLLLGLAAPIRLLVIPSMLFVKGDATATAANIAAHEGLFRLGIVTDLFSGTILIFIVLAFHRLFKDVDWDQSVRLILLGGVLPAAIYFLNVANDLAALLLVRGADYLAVFDKPQRDALAMFFLRLHGQEILAAETLWGLWLFPMAILTWKSRFLPRFLAVWLGLNGASYLALSFIGILWPHLEDTASTIAFPAQMGEVVFMLWLLIMGAKERPAETTA